MSGTVNRCTGVCETCGRCKGATILTEMNDRKTKMNFMPHDFKLDKGMKGYGLSVDIGTTTVAGNLWDLSKGESKSIIAKTNPQNVFGSDVISRIDYCGGNEDKLKNMQGKILNCINEMIAESCEKNNIKSDDIVKVVICGNTTMSHIFAGFDPSTLAKAPFAPAYTGALELTGKEASLSVSETARVMVLPGIAGHVGGDITAGILATKLESLDGTTLFIDIGTNGEIAIGSEGRILACSTAAGPAFEGAAILHGMRAAAGAIEKIRIHDGQVGFKTIDNMEPVGICGSGLIDAVSEMLKSGIINKTGRMAASLDNALGERIREGESGREFVLVYKEDADDIVITQKDIREVQLAKGAISAGIQLMLDELQLKTGDIDRAIIAGAFGNYIDKESAMTIGLLPELPPEKIISAGNTAGTGASLALLSLAEYNQAKYIAFHIQHIELSTCKNFQSEYLKAMSF